VDLYPELARCLGCNRCTKVCPQEIDVMAYVAAALRGDLREVSRLSFECILCGLCAANCPAEIPQYQIAMVARRMEGRYLMPPAPALERRIKEIRSGAFDEGLTTLRALSKEELEIRWKEAQAEVKRW
jgi:ferredoxin